MNKNSAQRKSFVCESTGEQIKKGSSTVLRDGAISILLLHNPMRESSYGKYEWGRFWSGRMHYWIEIQCKCKRWRLGEKSSRNAIYLNVQFHFFYYYLFNLLKKFLSFLKHYMFEHAYKSWNLLFSVSNCVFFDWFILNFCFFNASLRFYFEFFNSILKDLN